MIGQALPQVSYTRPLAQTGAVVGSLVVGSVVVTSLGVGVGVEDVVAERTQSHTQSAITRLLTKEVTSKLARINREVATANSLQGQILSKGPILRFSQGG